MYREDIAPAAPQLIRWGSVFAGAAIGLATLILLSALWFAVGFANDVQSVRDNIEWYVGISAVVALLIGGYIAGLSGTRGIGGGIWNGVTLWALVLIASLAIGIPGFLGFANVGQVPAQGQLEVPSGPTWATFWALVIGLVAAAVGGALGGLTPRAQRLAAAVPAPAYAGRHERVEREHAGETREFDRTPQRHSHEEHAAMSTDELRDHAREQGIDDADDLSRAELLGTLDRREMG